MHIDSGICPWNLLLARDKKLAEIMELPMLAGITELKLFLDKSKCITDGEGVDSCPWSWLEERSRTIIVVFVEKFRLSKGPSR